MIQLLWRDYHTGCQNTSHCQQQSYSGLCPPGWSCSTYLRNWISLLHNLKVAFWISKLINDTNQMWLIQQTTLPIRPFGKIHVFCNFTVIFVIVYFCLMIWFSKLYVSWACFKNYKEVLELCQSTNMVSFLTKHTDVNYVYWHLVCKILKTQNLYTCPLAYNFLYRYWGKLLVTGKELQKLLILAEYDPPSPWKVEQTNGIYIPYSLKRVNSTVGSFMSHDRKSCEMGPTVFWKDLNA